MTLAPGPAPADITAQLPCLPQSPAPFGILRTHPTASYTGGGARDATERCPSGNTGVACAICRGGDYRHVYQETVTLYLSLILYLRTYRRNGNPRLQHGYRATVRWIDEAVYNPPAETPPGVGAVPFGAVPFSGAVQRTRTGVQTVTPARLPGGSPAGTPQTRAPRWCRPPTCPSRCRWWPP